MREGGGRAGMALLLASRRGLSFVTSFSAASARVRCTAPAARHFASQGLPATLPASISCNSCSPRIPVAQAAQQRHDSVRAMVAPLSMAAARDSARDSPGNKINNNSSSINANSGASSSKRKPRHTSTSRSPDDTATTSPGGAKRRLSAGTTPVGGRSTGTAPWGARAAGGRGGRGWGEGSSYGAGGGRGGRGPTTRRLHDGRSYTPRPQRLGEIPEDQLQISFTRASGAGGQNVNKVSTKVEMRFVVSEAEWLPSDVRLRLERHEKGRVNNKGELVITAQEFRTQKQNRAQALQKLREMINEAWEPAKERKMRTGIGKKGKEIRKQDKLHRSKVKAGRSKLSSRDFD